MDEYISKQKVLDYLNGYLHSLGGADALFDRGQRRALVNAIQDIIAVKATDVQPVNQWISVKDRLPDATEATVLIWIKEGKADGIEISDCCHIGYWVKNSKEFCDMDWNVVSGITHWMSLPEPPKDGDAE